MCRACDNDPQGIHSLIRHEAPIDEILVAVEERLEVNLRSPCGKSPLMTAAYYCRKDVLGLLLEKGAVVSALAEGTGDTAAHFVGMSLAGHIRQCACLMVLVEHGAPIDIKNDDGYTVYELASKNGNRDIGSTGDAMMTSGEEEEE